MLCSTLTPYTAVLLPCLALLLPAGGDSCLRLPEERRFHIRLGVSTGTAADSDGTLTTLNLTHVIASHLNP